MAITVEDLKNDEIVRFIRGLIRSELFDFSTILIDALRFIFKRKDIEPSSILLRQKFTDTDEIIGLKNRCYEIDILADGEALLVFEIKSVCDLEMAERFADKVALIKHIYPNKTVNGALISLESDPEVIGYCKTRQIALVN